MLLHMMILNLNNIQLNERFVNITESTTYIVGYIICDLQEILSLLSLLFF